MIAKAVLTDAIISDGASEKNAFAATVAGSISSTTGIYDHAGRASTRSAADPLEVDGSIKKKIPYAAKQSHQSTAEKQFTKRHFRL